MVEGKFFFPFWAAGLVTVGAGVEVPRSLADMLVISVDGVELPLLTAGLAVTGVLLSRPLTPRRDPPLTARDNILITAILLLLALAAVVEYRPGILFTLIVSLGLGYSGFSIVELLGEEIKNVIRGLFGPLKTLFSKTPKDKE